MLNLTTTIPIPNVNRVDVLKFIDNRDDEKPTVGLTFRLVTVGNRDAGTYTVTASDTMNSVGLFKKTAPAALPDFVTSGSLQLAGACTAIGNAYDAAGNRAAKRNAAYAAAVACGLIGPELAAT